MIYALKMWLKGRLSQAQWEWLKHLRQRLVGRRAYMNPSYAIEGEDRIVRALLWQKRDSGFYVDVGAHHPFRFSNTYLFYTQGWRGINIDATPGSMEAFRKYRARDINLEMGIGEITESSAKNLAQDNLAGGGGSSLAKTFLAYHIFDESSWNTFDEEVAKNSLGKLLRVVKVPFRTLSDVLEEYLPSNQEIDFLSVDCEGFDLSVLRSNDWSRFKPNIVIVEILSNVYGELDFSALQDNEIAQFLAQQGYVIVAKAHNSVIFQRKEYLKSKEQIIRELRESNERD